MSKVSNVFWISLIIASAFVIWGVVAPVQLGEVMDQTKAFFLETFGWFYQLAASFFLLFSLFLIFSKYGKIKLGADEDKPDFSRATWFAMLFSAGMGIGLLFFGVSKFTVTSKEKTPELKVIDKNTQNIVTKSLMNLPSKYYKDQFKAPSERMKQAHKFIVGLLNDTNIAINKDGAGFNNGYSHMLDGSKTTELESFIRNE